MLSAIASNAVLDLAKYDYELPLPSTPCQKRFCDIRVVDDVWRTYLEVGELTLRYELPLCITVDATGAHV